MKILITGASGFIGRRVVRKFLEAGTFDVSVAVRRRTELLADGCVRQFEIGNISDFDDWRDILRDIDVVIHAAGRAHVLSEKADEPFSEFMKVNCLATKRLAKEASAAGVKRFVFISTIGVYGHQGSTMALDENVPARPIAPYAIAKLQAENELRAIGSSSKMDVVIIRPPLVCGHDAPGNFGLLLRSISWSVPMPFALVRNARSLIGVSNLAHFILTCSVHRAAANETFVVAEDTHISTPELICALAAGMGKRPLIFPFPLTALKIIALVLGKVNFYNQLCGSLRVNARKARTLLGWRSPEKIDRVLHDAASRYLESRIG